jgi:hypothetical protein
MAGLPQLKICLLSLTNFASLPPVRSILPLILATVPCALGLLSCSSQVTARQPVSYRFEPGHSVHLTRGLAFPPRNAPTAVKRAIAAANRLQRLPYKWGGGHAQLIDSGYDCSGTVSYVLREAGLISGCLASKEYFNYGEAGPGKWITIYVRRGHVFMTIAGLRLDTGGHGERTGPRWKPESRQVLGHVLRHPAGY